MNPSAIRLLFRHFGEKAGSRNCHPHRLLQNFAFEYLCNDVDNRDKGRNNSSRNSSSAYKPVTRLKQGHCRYCGAEVILDELPDSIARDAFEDFGICLNCQWGIFTQNGGHF